MLYTALACPHMLASVVHRCPKNVVQLSKNITKVIENFSDDNRLLFDRKRAMNFLLCVCGNFLFGQ